MTMKVPNGQVALNVSSAHTSLRIAISNKMNKNEINILRLHITCGDVYSYQIILAIDVCFGIK